MEPWNIDTGELRHLVKIEVKGVAQDTPTGTKRPSSRGHPVRTWNLLYDRVWCKIETPTGRKLELTRQLVATASHIITMRYRPFDDFDVNTHRVKFGDRIFNVGYRNNVEERNVKLELFCTEELPKT